MKHCEHPEGLFGFTSCLVIRVKSTSFPYQQLLFLSIHLLFTHTLLYSQTLTRGELIEKKGLSCGSVTSASAMKTKELIMHGLLILGCFIGSAASARPQMKAESLTPIPTLSPPEGNTTFIDGMTWCVARPGASQDDLQNALDWACGPGGADCSPLQPGGRCYQPDTLLTHASYAFNIFYQQNGNSDIACNFGGTGAIVKRDPSFGSCKFLVSETSAASSVNLRRTRMIFMVNVAASLIALWLRVIQDVN